MFGTLMPTWFIITTPWFWVWPTAVWAARPTRIPATNSITPRIVPPLYVGAAAGTQGRLQAIPSVSAPRIDECSSKARRPGRTRIHTEAQRHRGEPGGHAGDRASRGNGSSDVPRTSQFD